MIDDENVWPSLSLILAMRGMEDEEMPEYTVADLKERFSLTGDAQGTPAQGCEQPLWTGLAYQTGGFQPQQA